MVVENSVPAEFMQNDTVITSDAERVSCISSIGEGERSATNSRSACCADTMRIDFNTIRRVYGTAVVNGARKRCSAKIARASETHAVKQAEEFVTMVIRVHCREIVSPCIKVEIRATWFSGWCHSGRLLNIRKLNVVSCEGLGTGHWRHQTWKHIRNANRIQRRVVRRR